MYYLRCGRDEDYKYMHILLYGRDEDHNYVHFTQVSTPRHPTLLEAGYKYDTVAQNRTCSSHYKDSLFGPCKCMMSTSLFARHRLGETADRIVIELPDGEFVSDGVLRVSGLAFL